LVIEDWTQYQIPNPQSPNPNPQKRLFLFNQKIKEILNKKYN